MSGEYVGTPEWRNRCRRYGLRVWALEHLDATCVSPDTGQVHRPTRDSLTQRPMRALGWDEPVREHGYTDTEAAELLERR